MPILFVLSRVLHGGGTLPHLTLVPPGFSFQISRRGGGAEFKAFGMDVSLKNKLLMSRMANIAYVGADRKADRRNVNESTLNCHMLYRSENL